jgi:hypothetical protein
VGSQLDLEACPAQASEDGVVMAECGGAGCFPRFHQADRPAVTAQDRTGRESPCAHGRLPTADGGRQADLAEHDVDHPVQEVALTSHVVVQRHRLDPEDLAEPAHAEGADAAFVGEGDRGLEYLVAAQRRPPGRGLSGCRHPTPLSSRLTLLTP